MGRRRRRSRRRGRSGVERAGSRAGNLDTMVIIGRSFRLTRSIAWASLRPGREPSSRPGARSGRRSASRSCGGAVGQPCRERRDGARAEGQVEDHHPGAVVTAQIPQPMRLSVAVQQRDVGGSCPTAVPVASTSWHAAGNDASPVASCVVASSSVSAADGSPASVDAPPAEAGVPPASADEDSGDPSVPQAASVSRSEPSSRRMSGVGGEGKRGVATLDSRGSKEDSSLGNPASRHPLRLGSPGDHLAGSPLSATRSASRSTSRGLASSSSAMRARHAFSRTKPANSSANVSRSTS